MTRTKHSTIESTPTPAPIKPEYLTSNEVADLLLVSPRVIGQYIKGKGLKASKIGKRLIITREAVDEFVRSRAVSA